MKSSLRVAIGWLAAIGGGLGVLLMVYVLFSTGRLEPKSAFVVASTFAYFAFGLYSGVATIRGEKNWPKLALAFWASQLPFVALPFFAYLASAPLGVWVFASTEPRLGISFYAGSQVQLGLGSSLNTHPLVGINVVALAVVVVLLAGGRRGEA